MQIAQHMQEEANALRAQAAQGLQNAQTEAARLEAQAKSLEEKIVSIPAELGSLADEAGAKAYAWLKTFF